MEGNNTSSYEEILPCHNETEKCYHSFVQINDWINCLSIIINVLHLILLNRMKELKRTKFFWILVNISLSDILYSISDAVFFSCKLKEIVKQLQMPTAHWVSKSLILAIGCGTFSRVLVFLVSSIEKYIGVCHPYRYGTHFFVKNIKSMTVVFYFLGFLNFFASNMLPKLEFCWTPIAIQIVSREMGYSVVYMLYALELLALSFITSVFLVKVWKELKLMSQRNLPEDELVISASKYIIWSYLLYQLHFSLVVVFLICQSFSFLAKLTVVLETISASLFSFYGIVNVFMFIYFHPKYIDHVKNILRIGIRSQRVVRPREIN